MFLVIKYYTFPVYNNAKEKKIKKISYSNLKSEIFETLSTNISDHKEMAPNPVFTFTLTHKKWKSLLITHKIII